MVYDRSFSVVERVPGYTLSELTYKRPELLDEHKVNIAFQLGMHTVFSYVFGVRDGYQTNYIYDPTSKLLTRIDKDKFLEVPKNPLDTMKDGDKYTQEIAACELSNLKYVPSFREGEDKDTVLNALEAGFTEKYRELKAKKTEFLELVVETRTTWWELNNYRNKELYEQESHHVVTSVECLIDQDPQQVWRRLLRAKQETVK